MTTYRRRRVNDDEGENEECRDDESVEIDSASEIEKRIEINEDSKAPDEPTKSIIGNSEVSDPGIRKNPMFVPRGDFYEHDDRKFSANSKASRTDRWKSDRIIDLSKAKNASANHESEANNSEEIEVFSRREQEAPAQEEDASSLARKSFKKQTPAHSENYGNSYGNNGTSRDKSFR